MRIILLFLIFVCFGGCDKSFPSSSYQISEKEKLSDSILAKVAEKLKLERGLILCGTGGGMMHQIRMLALSFDYRECIDITKGRELLVAAVNELVFAVNADERIRPYLMNYPFESKNVEIRIFIKNPDRSDVPQGNIRIISAISGMLEFDCMAEDQYHLKCIYREAFDQALKKTTKERVVDQKEICLTVQTSSGLQKTLGVKMPSRFVCLMQKENGAEKCYEFIPDGESANGWSELITVMQLSRNGNDLYQTQQIIS